MIGRSINERTNNLQGKAAERNEILFGRTELHRNHFNYLI